MHTPTSDLVSSGSTNDQEGKLRGIWIRHLSWIVVGFVVVSIIHAATFINLVKTWWGTTAYDHCILIPFISLYLIWAGRERVRSIVPDISYVAMFYIAGNAVLWLFGNLLSINVLEHLSAIGFFIGIIWTMIGNRAMKAVLFPVLYLYFMLPEGGFLVPYLQDWTATVVVLLLRLTEIPVFLEGRYLQIPSGSFKVAKACSGINYLIATLAVGSMFAYLTYRSNWRRTAFMALAITVPLIANGVRAYGIVMIAHLSDYRYAMGVDHFIYGWLFFGVVIFILFAIGRTFADDGVDLSNRSVPFRGQGTSRGQRSPLSALLAITLLSFMPTYALTALHQDVRIAGDFELQRMSDWTGPAIPEISLSGQFPGAFRVLSGDYSNSRGGAVTLDLAIYTRQRQGAEIVNHENAVFDSEKWRLISGEGTEKTGLSVVPEVQSRLIRSGNQERLVWWWYQVGDRSTASAIAAKLLEAVQRLLGQYRAAAIIVVSSETSLERVSKTRSLMASFLETANPSRSLTTSNDD